MPGSSENFENFEYEFEDVTKSISRKLNSQLPNYTGEQRKACIRQVTKEIERADDLIREMEMESREAPAQYRTRMNSKIKGYQADLEKFNRDLKTAASSSGGGGGGGGGRQNNATDRTELLGGDSWESQTYDQRSRLMDSEDTLATTSGRITNAQRIGEESEQIGAGVLNELGRQRETIVRTAHKVQGTDANLGKSKRILNAMSRRVMTNQLVMVLIILVLMGILGIAIWWRLSK